MYDIYLFLNILDMYILNYNNINNFKKEIIKFINSDYNDNMNEYFKKIIKDYNIYNFLCFRHNNNETQDIEIKKNFCENSKN